ncbi:MAG: hypothetical protein JNL80_14825 [Phycisphaerae bacterium]|nr:hypothetical protein [Phycisphaerae bacterium]
MNDGAAKHLRCPTCGSPLGYQDIDVTEGVRRCPGCRAVTSLSDSERRDMASLFELPTMPDGVTLGHTEVAATRDGSRAVSSDEALPGMDVSQPPPGCWYHGDEFAGRSGSTRVVAAVAPARGHSGGGVQSLTSARPSGTRVVLGVRTREGGVPWAILFSMLFWNSIVSVFVTVASVSTLRHLGVPFFRSVSVSGGHGGSSGVLPLPMTVYLWIFLVPFIAIGAWLLLYGLFATIGHTTVALDDEEIVVTEAIGPLRWRRRCLVRTVRGVRSRTRQLHDAEDGPYTTHSIELDGDPVIRFGSMLPDRRRRWLAAALSLALAPVGARDADDDGPGRRSDPGDPPHGCIVQQRGNEILLTVRLRAGSAGWSSLFPLLFVGSVLLIILLLAMPSLLLSLGGALPASWSNELPVVEAIPPLVAIGVSVIWLLAAGWQIRQLHRALVPLSGRLRVRVRPDRVSVWAGLLPFLAPLAEHVGKPLPARHVDPRRVESIGIEPWDPSAGPPPMEDAAQIVIRAGETLRFGSRMNERQREWLHQTLQIMLLPRRRA